MTFYIYNPEGNRLPYDSREDWRKVEPTDKGLPVEKFNPSLKKKGGSDRSVLRDKKKSKKEEDFFLLKKKESKESPILASQIMTSRVTTLKPDDSLEKAWKIVYEKRFRHIPILSEKGKLVGIFSDRGLIHELFDFRKEKEKKKICIRDFMVSNVLTARPSTEISYIAKVFIDERIGSMPITDERDRLVGILTRSDILRTLVKVTCSELRI